MGTRSKLKLEFADGAVTGLNKKQDLRRPHWPPFPVPVPEIVLAALHFGEGSELGDIFRKEFRASEKEDI